MPKCTLSVSLTLVCLISPDEQAANYNPYVSLGAFPIKPVSRNGMEFKIIGKSMSGKILSGKRPRNLKI